MYGNPFGISYAGAMPGPSVSLVNMLGAHAWLGDPVALGSVGAGGWSLLWGHMGLQPSRCRCGLVKSHTMACWIYH